MYAIGTELQLVPGSSPEVVKELTTNKPADLGCLAQRNESANPKKRSSTCIFFWNCFFTSQEWYFNNSIVDHN